jgi:hypothetical protein
MNYNDLLMKQLPFVVDGRKTLPHHATKRWSRRDPSDIKSVVLHQSLEERGSAAGNSKYHVGPNHISDTGLPGLSYCGFIEKDGKLHLANDIEDVTWSQGTEVIAGDENHLYIAFCIGGNFSGPGYKGTQEPTLEQLHSVALLWQELKAMFNLKNNQLFGHYDFGKPACPGYVLMKFIDGVNADRDWVGSEFNFGTIDGRQKALQKLGFFTIVEDTIGEWDLNSKGALIAFQRKAGLAADGVWGRNTEAAIVAALEKA